jgi:subtilisin family serine protease
MRLFAGFIPLKAALVTLVLPALLGASSPERPWRMGHQGATGAACRQTVEGELLVKYKKGTEYSRKLSSIASKKSRRIHEFGGGYIRVAIPDGVSAQTAAEGFLRDPGIESVQRNHVYRAAAVPDDPSFALQWPLRNTGQTVASPSYTLPDGSPVDNPGTAGCDMNIVRAWDEITDCRAVTVAVLDTGVNYDHEDLADNMWDGGAAYPKHGYDFTGNGSADPIDRNGHGTMVAGVIGARGNNSVGAAGVCWRASIMAVKVLDGAGNGTSASVIDGIDFAAANGAKVICMSLVTHAFDQAVYDALKNAREKGVLVVAAAGNDAADIDGGRPAYPCGCDLDNIIGVTALDQNGALARFTNYGASSVDIAAPGVNIVNAWAGTVSTIVENFSTGWTPNDANHPGTSGWGSTWKTDVMYPAVKHWCLINPAFNEYYGNNIIDKVWKDYASFCLTADGVTLNLSVDYSLYDAGDSFGIYYGSGASEPSSVNSVKVDEIVGGSGSVTSCCDLTSLAGEGDHRRILFQLRTNTAGNEGSGIMISDMSVTGLWLSPSAYTNYSGTSVAAAHVAGLAAMLFAFNPDFTCADVAQSVFSGGRAVPALSGKNRTGRAADAEGSIGYISAPERIRAEMVKE